MSQIKEPALHSCLRTLPPGSVHLLIHLIPNSGKGQLIFLKGYCTLKQLQKLYLFGMAQVKLWKLDPFEVTLRWKLQTFLAVLDVEKSCLQSSLDTFHS